MPRKAKLADYREISVSAIHSNPHQPRKRFDTQELNRMAKSLKEIGLLEALIVRVHPDIDDEFILISGERRWRALQIAGIKQAQCVVRLKQSAPILILEFMANELRVDLTPLEKARTFAELKSQGMKVPEIARQTSLSANAVYRKLSLLNLPETVQQLLEKGKLTEADCIALLRAKKTEGWTEAKLAVKARTKSEGGVVRELSVGRTDSAGGAKNRAASLPKDPEGQLARLFDRVHSARTTRELIRLLLGQDETRVRALLARLKSSQRRNHRTAVFLQAIDSLRWVDFMRQSDPITPFVEACAVLECIFLAEMTGQVILSRERIARVASTEFGLELDDTTIQVSLELAAEYWAAEETKIGQDHELDMALGQLIATIARVRQAIPSSSLKKLLGLVVANDESDDPIDISSFLPHGKTSKKKGAKKKTAKKKIARRATQAPAGRPTRKKTARTRSNRGTSRRPPAQPQPGRTKKRQRKAGKAEIVQILLYENGRAQPNLSKERLARLGGGATEEDAVAAMRALFNNMKGLSTTNGRKGAMFQLAGTVSKDYGVGSSGALLEIIMQRGNQPDAIDLWNLAS